MSSDADLPVRPKRMQAGERRNQLLDVTLKLIVEEGFATVSIDRIARESNVARTAVYAQFASLDELLEQLATRSEQQAIQKISKLVPESIAASAKWPNNPSQLLIDSLRRFGGVISEDKSLWHLIFVSGDTLPPKYASRFTEGRERVATVLSPLVEQGLANRGLSGLDAYLVTRMLQAIVREAAKLHLSDPERFPAEAFATQLEVVLKTLPMGKKR